MRPLDGAQGRPPRIPRTMLLWIAPREDRAAIVGDLDEEFHQHRSAARYWTSALASMPAIVRLRWHRLSPLADLSRDLRHGLRSMRRHPGFAAAAIVTMALGAGVAIVVASVVQAILLRPLPYPDAARVEAIQERDMTRPGAGSRTSWSDYVELSERQHSYTVIAAFDGSSRTLTGNGPADRLPAVEVTASFFDVLGVAPSSGRGFVPSDAVSGGAPVVILSNGAWKRLLAGDGSAIGRTLTLNGTPHTVIGILPPGFIFPPRGGVDLWLPLRPSKAQQDRRYFHWLDIVARRRADVTAAQAHQELQAIAGEWQKRDAWHGSIALRRVSLRDDIVAGVRPAMLVLSGAALLLLLAAVTSVSGLILSRAAGRAAELDVRAALGATRFRLLRQLAVESACVASCGTALGLLLGTWAVSSFAAMVPARYRVSLPYADTIGVSPRAALFTLLFCCTAVIVASIAPAWRSGARRVPPGVGSVRTTQGRGTARLRTTLVAAQIALAVVLLAGAALIGRSVVRLTHVSPGFDLRGLITAQLSLPGARYANADATRAAMDRLLERLRAVPGVTAAEAIDQVALTGSGSTADFTVAGRAPSGEAPATALIRSATPGYFGAMGIPVIEGRPFEPSDTAASQKVVVVNRTLATRFFPDRSLIGERIVFTFVEGQPAWTIVGVTGDEQFNDLDRPMAPVVYFPFAQAVSSVFSLVVRAALPSGDMRDPLRAAVASIDPELPLYGMRTLEQVATESTPMFLRAIVLRLLALFSLAALALGGVGVYGVLSETMTSRTREIGIRMALGATRGGIGRLVMRAGALPAGAGFVAGGLLTAAAAPALRSLLFGVTLLDLPSLAAVIVLLACVTLAACALPARRAMRMPVTTALRTE